MKIGTILTLEYIEAGNKEEFKCKIIEKDQQLLFIDFPVHLKTKKTKIFPVGTVLNASYVDGDHAVYHFKTMVTGKKRFRVPALSLEIPSQDEVKRIQRRQYVRVETAVDIAVHSKKIDQPSFTTVTTDLSGGGLSFVIPKHVNMEQNEKVIVRIALHMSSGEYQYFRVEGEVVRVIDNKHSLNLGSLKFTSVPNDAQQYIVRYCFEKQREQRKKELY